MLENLIVSGDECIEEISLEDLPAIIRLTGERINIKTQAARVLFRGGASNALFDEFANHPSRLIRLGVLLGCIEAGQRKRVEYFLFDADSWVREEAIDGLVQEEEGAQDT